MIINDEKAKEIYEGLNLEKGCVIQADSHAEFLNTVLDKDYKGWMKCVWNVPETGGRVYIWMVRIDGISRNGWANYHNGDNIEEINVERTNLWNGEDIYTRNKTKPYRIVAEITEIAGRRYYKILGLYKYSDESTFEKHIITKIM